MAVLGKPTVSNGVLPNQRYIGRFVDANPNHVTPKGTYLRVSVELMGTCDPAAPDYATDKSGAKVKVAGLKADAYLNIDPTSARYADTYEAAERLGLLLPDGGFDAERIAALIKNKNVNIVFETLARGERAIARETPKPGEKVGKPLVGADGKEISLGARLALFQASDFRHRLDASAFGLTDAGRLDGQ